MNEIAEPILKEVARLKEEIEGIKAEILPLKNKLKAKQAQLEPLESYLKEIGVIEKKYDSLTDVIVDVLSSENKPMHYKEIYQFIVNEHGYEFNSRRPLNNITAVLSSSEKFIRVAPGMYKLVDE